MGGLPPVTLAQLEAMAEPVEAPNGTVIAYLPLAQMLAFMEARDARWRLALEMAERKLASIVAGAIRLEADPDGGEATPDGAGGEPGPSQGSG